MCAWVDFDFVTMSFMAKKKDRPIFELNCVSNFNPENLFLWPPTYDKICFHQFEDFFVHFQISKSEISFFSTLYFLDWPHCTNALNMNIFGSKSGHF